MSLIRRRLIFFHVKNDSFQVIDYHAEFFREALIQYGIESKPSLAAERPKIKPKKITYILEGDQGRKTQN